MSPAVRRFDEAAPADFSADKFRETPVFVVFVFGTFEAALLVWLLELVAATLAVLFSLEFELAESSPEPLLSEADFARFSLFQLCWLCALFWIPW